MIRQKVLVIDIETAPILAYVWDTRDQNIAVNQIVKDWSVIAWSAKWLGGKQQVYYDARASKDVSDDKALLQPIWDLLDTADIVIGQNSKGFDTGKLNARFMKHGMKPPSPYRHLDTYLIAKNSGKFTKNSLEYLAEYLGCKHTKLKHSKFPGQELWNECLKGNKAAWDEMKRYNINDVLVAEDIYEKLKAWVPDNAPDVYAGEAAQGCRVCGGKTQRRGSVMSRTGAKPRFHCQQCGRWQNGRTLRRIGGNND